MYKVLTLHYSPSIFKLCELLFKHLPCFQLPSYVKLCAHVQNQILCEFPFFCTLKERMMKKRSTFPLASDCAGCMVAALHAWTPAGGSEIFMV